MTCLFGLPDGKQYSERQLEEMTETQVEQADVGADKERNRLADWTSELALTAIDDSRSHGRPK